MKSRRRVLRRSTSCSPTNTTIMREFDERNKVKAEMVHAAEHIPRSAFVWQNPSGHAVRWDEGGTGSSSYKKDCGSHFSNADQFAVRPVRMTGAVRACRIADVALVPARGASHRSRIRGGGGAVCGTCRPACQDRSGAGMRAQSKQTVSKLAQRQRPTLQWDPFRQAACATRSEECSDPASSYSVPIGRKRSYPVPAAALSSVSSC